MQTEDINVTEQDIAELVRLFYQRASNDARLKGIFDSVSYDWDAHQL